jgi:hypothetical protein
MAQDEKDHEKQITIIVNGRKKTVSEKEMTYDEIVKLAFDPVPPDTIFVIGYMFHGKDGSLKAGQAIHVKDGMVFDVTDAGKS